MRRRDHKITLSLAPGSQEKLEQLALNLGYTWGDRGNISAMLDGVADGSLTITPADIPPGDSHRRKAILEAIALCQEGANRLEELIQESSA